MTRIVSWNVHGFVAPGSRYSPEPVARVLEQLAADVVILQEVEDRRWRGIRALDWLASKGDWFAWAGPTLMRGDAHYGNAVLSRFPAINVCRHDLTIAGSEPRGLLDVEFAPGSGRLRILATHLGLRRRDRLRQVAGILAIAGGARPGSIDVLAGDFNEWRPGTTLLARLRKAFPGQSRGATFPARWPLFALDRIFVRPSAALAGCRVVPLAARESDHRPIVGTLKLPRRDRD